MKRVLKNSISNFGLLWNNPKWCESSIAIENDNGEKFTYGDLIEESLSLYDEFFRMEDECSGEREGQNIAFLFNPSFDYVKVNCAIWLGKHCAVPISSKSPIKELEYFVEDTDVTKFFFDSDSFSDRLQPLIDKYEDRIEFIGLPGLPPDRSGSSQRSIDQEIVPPETSDPCVIFYTSGTTGPPKGVVHTFGSIEAQIRTLVDSWEICEEDQVLHVLPLHHVHGVINSLYSTLFSGGKVKFLSPFEADRVWKSFRNENISLFHAVPTIYGLLLSDATYCIDKGTHEKEYYRENCSNLRLMVSGSAALPTSVFEGWDDLTGQPLLERYGMTEFGMALGNPYRPIEGRESGKVGYPLGEMEVKIEYSSEDAERSGELLVRGNQLFQGYYNREEVTSSSFDDEGWFLTGDIASVDERGVYRILGRSSQDIIKSSGYKISALDIEREIIVHENVEECCVLGLPDEILGEAIVAVLVLGDPEQWSKVGMARFLKERLSYYKIPRRYILLEDVIPRNQMGKINKTELRKLILEEKL